MLFDRAMPKNAISHIRLALKILDAIYQIGDAKYDSSDIETLKSYLAEEPKGLADDQIACSVIENEVQKLRGEIRGLQT